MSIEVYVGHRFQHGHERRALGIFLQMMLDRYANSTELYRVIIEAEVGTAAMDLLLIGPHHLVIVEFKELTQVTEQECAQVSVRGKQNGPWTYYVGDGQEYILGGSNTRKNPFRQVKNMRFELAEWLEEHSAQLHGNPWTKDSALDCIQAWVALSPGFDGDKSQLDIPWNHKMSRASRKLVKDWFKVIPIRKLDWEFHCTSEVDMELSELHLDSLVEELGVKREENLRELLPNFLPAPRIPFYTSAPPSRNIVDRELEQVELLECLEDRRISVIVLGGPGGIGKTALAIWLANEVRKSGYKTCWVDCSKREITVESLLAAVAAEAAAAVEIKYRQKALTIRNQKQKLSDRFDAALDWLDQIPTFFIFDDYHAIAQKAGIDEFITHAMNNAESLRIIITTRERPERLDYWAPWQARDIQLSGLPLEVVSEFIRDAVKLSTSQITSIWERSSGNPYIMKMFIPIIRKYGWNDIRNLPLYTDNETDTFTYLVKTLTDEAKSLAYRLSVLRGEMDLATVERLAPQKEQAIELKCELVEKYILQEREEPGSYIMYELVRDFLYARMAEATKNKAHRGAGNYFAHLADNLEAGNEFERADYLIKAIHHFERGQNEKAILQHAPVTFGILIEHGDWDVAESIALQALTAARAQKDAGEISYWALQIAHRQINQAHFLEVKNYLDEARSSLDLASKKASPQQRAQYGRLETDIWIQKGRWAYRVQDYEGAYQAFEKGLQLARQYAYQKGIADCLLRLGSVERQRNRHEAAAIHFTAARELAEELGNQKLTVKSVSFLGLIALAQNETDEAKELFTEAYQIACAANDLEAIQINLSHLGDIALRAHNFDQAEKVFRECLDMARTRNNSLGITINMGWLAETLVNLGKLQEAERLITESEQRCEREQNQIGLAWCSKRKGQLAKAKGNIEGGNALIQQGIQILCEIGSEVYIPYFEQAIKA